MPQEKELLEDLMMSQLKIARAYNDCCACCTSESFRAEMLNILRDNYDIFNNEFNEAEKRGWIKENEADEEKIETFIAKYQPEN